MFTFHRGLSASIGARRVNTRTQRVTLSNGEKEERAATHHGKAPNCHLCRHTTHRVGTTTRGFQAQAYLRPMQRRIFVPPSPRVWICPVSLRTGLHRPGALVFMAHKRTTRRGFIHSSRSHAVQTWRTMHPFQLSSTHPTTPTPNTCRPPRWPCRHSLLRRPVPSLSRKSSNTTCLRPRNSRIRSHGTIRICSAQVRAWWPLHRMQAICSVCPPGGFVCGTSKWL